MESKDRKGLDKLSKIYLEEISSDEGADQYLREEGIDIDKLVDEGLRKIRQIRMNIAAEKTQQDYVVMKSNTMEWAKAEAKRMMADVSFNFQAFVKQHKINVAYRNFDELTKEEIQEFLERHLMLKSGKQNGGESE